MELLKRRNRSFGLVESLGQYIVSGNYPDDCPLTEADLSEQYGTTRLVTREAVKMLTAKGLLKARGRLGTWVQPESEWNLLDPDVLRWMLDRKFSLKLLGQFTEVRMAIEPMAAALAAKHAGVKDLEGIRRGINRMRAAEQGEDDALAADIEFHLAILHASNNPFYIQLSELVNTALRISIHFTDSLKDSRASGVSVHDDVLKAIVARKPAAARSAMTSLLTEVMDLIEHAGTTDDAQSRVREKSQRASS